VIGCLLDLWQKCSIKIECQKISQSSKTKHKQCQLKSGNYSPLSSGVLLKIKSVQYFQKSHHQYMGLRGIDWQMAGHSDLLPSCRTKWRWQKLPFYFFKRQKSVLKSQKRQQNLQNFMAQFMHRITSMRWNLPLNAGQPEDKVAWIGLYMLIKSTFLVTEAHYDTYEIICGIFSLVSILTFVILGIFI